MENWTGAWIALYKGGRRAEMYRLARGADAKVVDEVKSLPMVVLEGDNEKIAELEDEDIVERLEKESMGTQLK